MFTSDQRKGILFYCFYRALQLVYLFVDVNLTQTVSPKKKQEWLMQSKIDSIKASNSEYIVKVYPFNPNFITDYKATSSECLFRKLIGYWNIEKVTSTNSKRISSSYTSFDSLLKSLF
jgi:hypothetical protein